MKVFKEEQRFTQWWIWILVSCLAIIPIYGIVQQIVFKIPFGNNPMSDVGLIIFLVFMLLFVAFFFKLKLKTRIDEIGIHYYFFPIQLSWKTKRWATIKNITTIKYKPIQHYGGWGIKSNSYSVKGNIGIKIEYKNGESFLIGTQKEQEAAIVLKNYNHKLTTDES